MEEDFSAQHESLPTTREILGAHLHHKVAANLSENTFITTKTVPDGSLLVNKITGMLLERSLKDIHKMLEDGVFLQENLKMAMDVLQKDCPGFSQVPSNSRVMNRQGCSLDEIGESLFERICSIDEALAPQITGMLLELDTSSLLYLINNDGPAIEAAVQKAKDALLSVVPETESPSWLSQPPSQSEVEVSGLDPQSQEELEDAREGFGEKIYDLVMETHPGCASQITGMILELEPAFLRLLVEDREQLMLAINKAYTEWMKQS